MFFKRAFLYNSFTTNFFNPQNVPLFHEKLTYDR